MGKNSSSTIYPMEKSQLQAIFFDFDGVLVDSATIKTDAFRVLFKEYDEKTLDEIVAYHRLHAGISRIEKIAYIHDKIINRQLTKLELDELAHNYSQLVVEKVITAPWVPGAYAFLNETQKRVLLFVISGTPETELKRIIEKRDATVLFKEILGSPTKKPQHIRYLLKNYNLQAKQCVFVGDALTDFKAAMDTDVHFVGIQGEIDFPYGTLVLSDCRPLSQIIEQRFSWGSF